ncbi:MAG: TolC family protein [Pseudomonadota bacterium]
MFRSLIGRWPMAIVLFVCVEAQAATPAGPPVAAAEPLLTLSDAIRRVEAANPRLKAGAATVSAAVAERDQAGVLPNPELSLELENVAGTGAYTGADSVETTLAISQTLAGGVRRAGVAVAEANLLLTQDAQALVKLELAAETARRFIAVVAAQEKFALAKRAEALAENTRDDLERRAAAARAPIAERNRARMAFQRAKLDRSRAEQDLTLARRQLASLWGSREPDFASAEGSLFSLPPTLDDAGLRAALANSPANAALRNSERLREAEVAHAKAVGRPPITASVGLRNFADTSDSALLFGVSLPIPVFDRNRGSVVAAEARLEAQRADNELAQRDAELRLMGLLTGLQQAREEARTLHDDALPLAREALEQTRYGYERGRFSWLELASAQQELIDTENAAIDAAATYHTLLADIEALTGLAVARAGSNAGVQP